MKNNVKTERKFDTKAYYKMVSIQADIQAKLDSNRKNNELEKIYSEQLKIVNKCINSLY